VGRSVPRRLLYRLLAGTLAPTVAALLTFGFLAHEVARRVLEDELGRRLGTAAAGTAVMVLPEQLRQLGGGDEDSLTYANLRRKLEVARDRFGVRRAALVADDLTGRGDTDGRIALGGEAHALRADRAEIERARTGSAVASPLFVGHDGRPYKRGYAAVGSGGDLAGFAMVEGSADYFVALAAFRRWLVVGGAAALLAVLLVTVLVARRITRPLARLADAAARIGRGELEAAVPVESRDELGFLAMTLDEMRAALHARDERLQMMLAGIAHEVRNPLGGLELYAGLLREALAGNTDRLAEVSRIERELAYLKAVVTEFLDYARRPALEIGDVRLRPLLEEIRELALVEGGPGLSVTVSAADGLAVKADAGQLRRALLNLARNAVIATRAKPGEGARTGAGVVTLRAWQERDHARIEVADDGPGVAAELRDKIFTPFFSTREKGTGLGLAFVREIVQDHGSEVTVGERPGGGACFHFDLPLGGA
jgi:signal transduction histidine kinase